MREVIELLRDLHHDRRRLRMVVFALAWGTLGLTVLVAFGDGFDRAMRSVLHRSGDRMLRLSAGSSSIPVHGLPGGRRLVFDDNAIATAGQTPGLRRISVEYAFGLRVAAGGVAINARVRGVGAEFAALRGLQVAAGGRFLSELDVAERRHVAVLGEDLARNLFHGADPIGRELKIADTPHRVIGIVPRLATVLTYDGDDAWKVFAPSTTMRAMTGASAPTYLLCEPLDPAESGALARAIRGRLAPKMGFDPLDDRAVVVRDSAAEARRILALVVGTRLFLAVVGLLGLLVSASGIANSMVALTEERVAEIGLRRAVGATRAQIVVRPLAEAVALVVIGGGIGFVAATALLAALDVLPLDPAARSYLGSPIPTQAVGALVAGVLGSVAALAGVGPALRAARVDPVEALRHD